VRLDGFREQLPEAAFGAELELRGHRGGVETARFSAHSALAAAMAP
jgi:hypothetical protein